MKRDYSYIIKKKKKYMHYCLKLCESTTYLWQTVIHEIQNIPHSKVSQSSNPTPRPSIYNKMEYLTTLMQLQIQHLHVYPKSFFAGSRKF